MHCQTSKLGAAGLALLFTSIVCAGCEEQNAATVQPNVSATEPAASPPKGLPEPVVEKPSEPEPSVSRPKKKLEDCPSGNTLSFDNPELEQAIRFKLQKEKGDLTKADLKRLKSLNLSQMKVHELDICLFPHMTSLKELFLGAGDLDDLSPIENLTKLESLRASLNKVSDLKPLAKMTLMDRLDLGRTLAKDLSPLASMTKLTELSLDGTPVEDLTPLAGMKDLERLSIKQTQVKEVSALKDLKKLKFVYVQDTPADQDPMTLAPLRANGAQVISM